MRSQYFAHARPVVLAVLVHQLRQQQILHRRPAVLLLLRFRLVVVRLVVLGNNVVAAGCEIHVRGSINGKYKQPFHVIINTQLYIIILLPQ